MCIILYKEAIHKKTGVVTPITAEMKVVYSILNTMSDECNLIKCNWADVFQYQPYGKTKRLQIVEQLKTLSLLETEVIGIRGLKRLCKPECNILYNFQ